MGAYKNILNLVLKQKYINCLCLVLITVVCSHDLSDLFQNSFFLILRLYFMILYDIVMALVSHTFFLLSFSFLPQWPLFLLILSAYECKYISNSAYSYSISPNVDTNGRHISVWACMHLSLCMRENMSKFNVLFCDPLEYFLWTVDKCLFG